MLYLCLRTLVCISLQLLISGVDALRTDGQGYKFGAQRRKLYTTMDTVMPKSLHFEVQDGRKIEYLTLKRNNNVDINTPLCYTEFGDTICEYGANQNLAFYHSKDNSAAFSVSSDPLSNRLSVEGDIVKNKRLYKLEPGGHLSNTMVNKTTHYISKRSIFGFKSDGTRLTQTYWSMFKSQSQMQSYNFENLLVKTCYLSPEKRGRLIQKGRRMIQLRRVPFGGNHIRDSDNMNMNGKKYIVEVLILVDYSLYRKFYERNQGNDETTMTKLKYYFAHIVNGMDLRYSSIDKKGFGLNVRLAGFYVAKNASDLPFIITYRQGGDIRSKVDGGTTLLDLTNFLRGKNSAALPHYDHAMLFTEYDATNGRGYILGTSYLSGICTPMSTSVIVDHGSYNSAGIAAHELGHNLGVIYHDGDYAPVARSCPKELNYIMAPSSAIINNKTKDFSFKFSDCSINQIERQIKKLNRKRKNCLAEDPGPSFATLIVKPYLAIPPGQMEDVHMQCKQIYGERSFMCPPASPDEMCYKMYCYHPERKICITASEQRAALGSSCGHKKWCKLGKCVDDSKAPEVPNDCPFPDVPPPRALCKEEASPFRCENDPVFYRRCCQSCNKNFTDDEKCKDSKILINGLRCADFMNTYGTGVCNIDQNVKNYCCKSCSIAESNNRLTRTTVSSIPCKDNSYVRINGLDCSTFVLVRGKRVCQRPMVKSHCCFTCL